MSTPLNHPTDYHRLRGNLEALARDQRERADKCRPDDPTLEGNLTALIQIEAALERVNAGSYGLCGPCSRLIEPERLDALPRGGALHRLRARTQPVPPLTDPHRVDPLPHPQGAP